MPVLDAGTRRICRGAHGDPGIPDQDTKHSCSNGRIDSKFSIQKRLATYAKVRLRLAQDAILLSYSHVDR